MTMAAIIYEDTPRYDVWFKAILLLPVFFVLIAAVQLIEGDKQSAVGLFATALLVTAILWAIVPRKYCVLEDRLSIIMGGPFRFDIPYETVEIAKKPEGISLGINFATSMHNRNAVQVVRHGRMNVHITPSRPEEFIGHLNKAVDHWRSYGRRTS
jgi:hypothetical protein